MCSVRPRFSWITSSPPFGFRAGAHAASSGFVCELGNVIGWVGTASHSVTRPSFERCRRFDEPAAACSVNAASIVVAVAPVTPSRPSLRIASRRVMMPSAWSSATSSAR